MGFWNFRFQSTHPAWGETRWFAKKDVILEFQSTHPAWGETNRYGLYRRNLLFQSTHPAWGETDGAVFAAGGGPISIHSPRVG